MQGLKSYQNTKSIETMCSCGQLNRSAHNIVCKERMNSKIVVKAETVTNIKSKHEKHIVAKMPYWNKKMCINKVGENYYLVKYFLKLFYFKLFWVVKYSYYCFISEKKPKNTRHKTQTYRYIKWKWSTSNRWKMGYNGQVN